MARHVLCSWVGEVLGDCTGPLVSMIKEVSQMITRTQHAECTARDAGLKTDLRAELKPTEIQEDAKASRLLTVSDTLITFTPESRASVQTEKWGGKELHICGPLPVRNRFQ